MCERRAGIIEYPVQENCSIDIFATTSRRSAGGCLQNQNPNELSLAAENAMWAEKQAWHGEATVGSRNAATSQRVFLPLTWRRRNRKQVRGPFIRGSTKHIRPRAFWGGRGLKSHPSGSRLPRVTTPGTMPTPEATPTSASERRSLPGQRCGFPLNQLMLLTGWLLT